MKQRETHAIPVKYLTAAMVLPTTMAALVLGCRTTGSFLPGGASALGSHHSSSGSDNSSSGNPPPVAPDPIAKDLYLIGTHTTVKAFPAAEKLEGLSCDVNWVNAGTPDIKGTRVGQEYFPLTPRAIQRVGGMVTENGTDAVLPPDLQLYGFQSELPQDRHVFAPLKIQVIPGAGGFSVTEMKKYLGNVPAEVNNFTFDSNKMSTQVNQIEISNANGVISGKKTWLYPYATRNNPWHRFQDGINNCRIVRPDVENLDEIMYDWSKAVSTYTGHGIRSLTCRVSAGLQAGKMLFIAPYRADLIAKLGGAFIGTYDGDRPQVRYPELNQRPAYYADKRPVDAKFYYPSNKIVSTAINPGVAGWNRSEMPSGVLDFYGTSQDGDVHLSMKRTKILYGLGITQPFTATMDGLELSDCEEAPAPGSFVDRFLDAVIYGPDAQVKMVDSK